MGVNCEQTDSIDGDDWGNPSQRALTLFQGHDVDPVVRRVSHSEISHQPLKGSLLIGDQVLPRSMSTESQRERSCRLAHDCKMLREQRKDCIHTRLTTACEKLPSLSRIGLCLDHRNPRTAQRSVSRPSPPAALLLQ